MFARCFILAGCFMIPILTGCNTAGSGPAKPVAADQRPKIAIVSNNAEDFWTICEAGAKKGAEEFKAELYFRKPASGSADEQREIIDDLMSQGVNGLAISVNDPKNQLNFLNRIAAKIPLITQDNDAPDSKRICYIGTNNYQAGLAAGKLVKEALPDGGTIAICVRKARSGQCPQRRQAVLDELARKERQGSETMRQVHVVRHLYDDVNQDVAKERSRHGSWCS